MPENMALVVIDVTNDFCPGGALPVTGGDQVIPVLNPFITDFISEGFPVFLSREAHPPDSRHFEKWSKHGIEGTRGAKFHRNLNTPRKAIIVKKGTSHEDDGYSVFEAEGPGGSSFETLLRRKNIDTLVVGGLATDYCVKATVLDALDRGFKVKVIEGGIRAVDVNPGDGEKAIKEMKKAGAEFI